MRKALLLFFVFQIIKASGQQDPQFSQYMFNESYWVPSLMGIDGVASVFLSSRSQWVGYESSFDQSGGAPSTQYFNFSTPFLRSKGDFNIGATLLFDKLGPASSSQIHVPISQHFVFPRGTLSLGARSVINNYKVDFAQLDFVNPTEEGGGKESIVVYDLDAGISYSTENYTIGLGFHHLLRPKISYGRIDETGAIVPTPLLYNLYGQYDYVLNYKLTLSPSILVQTDIISYSINVGAIATYSSKLSGGISYRYAESVVFIFGYYFLENNSLNVGYSFDYVINDQDVKSQTSHEIYIKYNLPKFDSGAKKIIRTPRFRF